MHWHSNLITDIIITTTHCVIYTKCTIQISGFFHGVGETAIFWDVMQHILIAVYQKPLKMGLIGCPKKSVHNYPYMLHNITEEQRLHIIHNIFIPLANVIIIK